MNNKLFKSLEMIEKRALKKINLSQHKWLIGASEYGFTEKKNRSIFRKISIIPRVLNGISDIKLKKKFFDKEIKIPLIVAPMGGLSQFDKKAELKIASSCKDNQIPYFHSNYSRYSIREIKVKNNNLDFINISLYLDNNLSFIKKKINECIKLGLNTISITVDSPIRSISYDKLNYGYDARTKMRKISKELRSELLREKLGPINWNTIRKIRRLTNKPIILKGILSYKDALIAEDIGVDAIWVSNHGGRSSETDLTSLEVLPRIKSKLKKKTIIICDGGIRTGSDFVKTISLGADFVAVGRPIVHALISDKNSGLDIYFKLMEEELKTACILSGVDKINNLKNIDLKTHF